MKRIFDLAFASCAIVLTLPLMLGIAFAVVTTMGRPIFFIQKRPGLNSVPFSLVKFRTMQVGGPGIDPSGDAARLTKFGKFLRRTSLDELPELWNIIRGEMSFVGPRPLLMAYLERYSPEQVRRHSVRPGLTGWAQVNGRNSLSWEEKFALDLWYIDNRTFGLDLKIIALTLLRVLKGTGVSADASATMPEFRGTVEKLIDDEQPER